MWIRALTDIIVRFAIYIIVSFAIYITMSFAISRYIVDKNSVSCGLDIRFYNTNSYSYVLTTNLVLFTALAIAGWSLLKTLRKRDQSETQSFAPLFDDKELLKV